MIARSFIILSFFFLCACSNSEKGVEVAQPEEESLSKIVGEVTSVHSERGFILFRNYRSLDLSNGGSLSARSVDGRRAVGLQTTSEKLGRYHAATYSGDSERPRVGDLIVLSSFAKEVPEPLLPELMTQKVKNN